MDKIISARQVAEELERSPVDLERFVELVNALLPRYLPSLNDEKFALEINVRLLRYLATQGLVDEPFKVGREARYGDWHLLQTLAVRKLMAQRHTTTAIKSLLRGAEKSRLLALIEGDAQPDIFAISPFAKQESADSDAAFAALDSIRARSGLAPSPAPQSVVPAEAAPPKASQNWVRDELASGLEIHVRADFPFPATLHEREKLARRFLEILEDLQKSATKSSRSKRKIEGQQ